MTHDISSHTHKLSKPFGTVCTFRHNGQPKSHAIVSPHPLLLPVVSIAAAVRNHTLNKLNHLRSVASSFQVVPMTKAQ
jgi:hypothetical protein